ncbi:MAG: guanine deaminase [Clostridia bacterium]|nr:guanine deaminase [Clostridia bacterium]
MQGKKAIQANAYYSKNFDEIEYLDEGLFCIDSEGFIEKVLTKDDENYEKVRRRYASEGQLKVLEADQILLPGFVDLHIHAPQWAQSGTALDRPLEIWLNEYTFPLEAKFEDQSFAANVYGEVVHTTLRNGTTSAVYFATVDRKSSLLLAEICGEQGQRGFVGKVAMDDASGCPEYYRDQDAQASIDETEAFIQSVLAIRNTYRQGVYPIITPRFIPTCTDESLKGLGALARKYDVHLQTHASESDWAHHYVKEKMGENDVKALNRFGLLGPRAIIAHAPFLETEDQEIMVETRTTIAHCPLSNAYFANSVLPVKDFMAKGITIGLATDISGGYTPSMYQAIRQAVISSKMLQDGVEPSRSKDLRGRAHAALTLNNALFMATVAGGQSLGLPLGKLEAGYIFDAQVVDTRENIPRFYEEKHVEDLLHKVLLLSQTVNIKEVWVQGEQVI